MVQFFPVYILAACYYTLGIVAFTIIYLRNSPRKNTLLNRKTPTYLNVTPMNGFAETNIDMNLEYAAN